MLIKELFDELKNKYSKHNSFQEYSSTYVSEFFMYISLYVLDIGVMHVPTAEVLNIYNNVVINDQLIDDIINTIDCYKNINVNVNTDFKYIDINKDFTKYVLRMGQSNFINRMKEIFNHENISTVIQEIKLKLCYHDHNFILYCFNTNSIYDLKQQAYLYLEKNNLIKVNINKLGIKSNIYLNDKHKLYNVNTNINLEIIDIMM